MVGNEFNFGENLRIVRQAKGISQEAMAIGLDMSQAKYSRLERQAVIPALELVEKIAGQLQVEPSVLLSGRDIADLVPKSGFEEKAREILSTPLGVVFYWIIAIPFINAAHDVGAGFCDGYGTSEGVSRTVSLTTGITAAIFIFYWMRRIQKGKG